MNKHLIILLVVIVAVNAFVKRDTPKEDEKGIGETIEEWANKAVEDLKTDLNKAIDDVSKSLKDFKEEVNQKS